MKNIKKYGDLPIKINSFEIDCKEMMFYQYLPIKMINSSKCIYEQRLNVFDVIVNSAVDDFICNFGINYYYEHYIYLTAKHQFQTEKTSFNRLGYHSDGFLTDDVNYIWSNENPTIFNNSKFNLTLDDKISLNEMELQALKSNEITFDNKLLLRLNQFNIHRVNESDFTGMRTFLKISFSKDKYDLIGNSHNYLLNYNWKMKERKIERNIPQTEINKITESEVENG